MVVAILFQHSTPQRMVGIAIRLLGILLISRAVATGLLGRMKTKPRARGFTNLGIDRGTLSAGLVVGVVIRGSPKKSLATS